MKGGKEKGRGCQRNLITNSGKKRKKTRRKRKRGNVITTGGIKQNAEQCRDKEIKEKTKHDNEHGGK